MKLFFKLTVGFLLLNLIAKAQTNSLPIFGAQIWIEPGQTQKQIEQWVKTLADAQMPIARIFVQWNYVQKDANTWDWTLYDYLFDAADKYKVKVIATLTTNQYPYTLDEYMYGKTQASSLQTTFQQVELAKKYIAQTVNRYKNRPSLQTWMLHNEPGQLPEATETALSRFRVYLQKKYANIQSLNSSWHTAYADFEAIKYHKSWDNSGSFDVPAPYLDWNKFWREHLTWYMSVIAEEIRKYDTTHLLHVNPHSIFENMRLYELPQWRNFLDVQGASIHPSWHFGLLRPEQYAMGVSATCDILRGSSEPKPFWISELQGGNNLYSGTKPLFPSSQHIAQWLWTGVGAGAQQTIYWCLNYRQFGGEAAEWSLLDFQSRPTERMQKTTEIAQVIASEKSFFQKATPSRTPIYILLSAETMMILRRKSYNDVSPRKEDAHIKAALSYYQALMQLGISPQIKMIDDFDWSKPSKTVAILPHVIALTSDQIAGMEQFTANGNKLIISGLTGFFDERESALLTLNPQPTEKLLGARIKEVRLTDDTDIIKVNQIILPTRFWISEIELTDTLQTKVIGKYSRWGNYPIAVRRFYGKGEVFWLPSMLDDDKLLQQTQSLTSLLEKEIMPFISSFRFKIAVSGVLMRYLTSGNQYVTIVVNQNDHTQSVTLQTPASLKPKMIYGVKEVAIHSKHHILSIPAGETVVIKWE